MTKQRERYRQIKTDLVIAHGSHCCDCGTPLQNQAEQADFDHVTDDKWENVSVLIGRVAGAPGREDYWEQLLDELKKCELVCANCHRTRGVERANQVAEIRLKEANIPQLRHSEADKLRLALESPWNQQTLCACNCGESFTEESRVGAPRRYINSRHARKQAMRTYRGRLKDGARIWEDRQCRRYVPKSLEEADKAFRLHCEYSRVGSLHCTKSTPDTSLRCPAVFHRDYECQKKLCIAYGTLLDDLMEWKMQGRYQRRFTNVDGFWLTDMEKADALNDLPEESENPWDKEGVYG